MRPSIGRARRATATAAVMLLAVLGVSAALIARYEEQQRDALASRFDTRRATAASFIEAYIAEVFEREKALGARSLAGSVTSERFVTIAAEQGFGAAVLPDAQGRLLASQPANPTAVGSDLGRRYAHLRAAVAGTPTVSGVVPSAARGLPVIGFAVPFATPSGRRVFSGGYLVEDTPLAPFVRNASPFKTANVVIVDARGVIMASNLSAAAGQPIRKTNPRLAQISTPTSYLGSGAQRQYISQSPISGTSWRLVFAVGTNELFAPLGGGGRWIPWLALVGFGASALIALAIFYPFLIQRAQLVDSEAHRRAILDTASDGFISMSSSGLITEWNRRAVELFGWRRDEAIGRNLADLIIAPAQREAHRSGLRRVLGGGQPHILDQRIEVSALHRDGRMLPVEIAVWRVSAGLLDQFSAFVRDISVQQQIARDVEAARDQAVEASRLKSTFMATMSHEIRTPMNGVIGLTGLLLQGDLDSTQRRYAEGIRTAGNALLAVINDILDFSKIEAGALVLEDATVNLGSLVENVVELVSQSAREKRLELLSYCDPTLPTLLRGDPVRIRQILLNLATNAVKFTDHGEVFLQIRSGKDPTQPAADPAAGDIVEVRFEVVDTGIGLKPADRARLFDAFAQADSSTTRRFGGTGLGLAICRELAEAMGGRIGVDSEPGRGSTFWCVIPLRTGRSGEQAPTVLDVSLKGRRVLVVDDNDTNRLILTQQLHNWAMLPTTIASGQEALRHLVEASTRGLFYDLAIIDMHMPGLDGLELSTQIQTLQGLPPLPLVLFTSGDDVDPETARAAGMVASLNKPVQQSQLYDCLVQVAAGKHRPAAQPSPPKDSPVPEVPALGRLLLVEDNDINQMVAVGILNRLGYTVDIAADGLQALELVATITYRAVLMDCQMPNMDGYEATTELRRREPQANNQNSDGTATVPRRLPIIAMTAAAREQDRDRCLAAGMDDFLTKPIQPDELAAVLTRWTADAKPAEPSAITSRHRSTEQEITARLDLLRDNTTDGMVIQLVTSFLKRAPTYLFELTDALHRDDTDAFAYTAHSLKGAAANLGANTVAATCDDLETLCNNGQLQAAPDQLQHLHLEYDNARRILQAVARNPQE